MPLGVRIKKARFSEQGEKNKMLHSDGLRRSPGSTSARTRVAAIVVLGPRYKQSRGSRLVEGAARKEKRSPAMPMATSPLRPSIGRTMVTCLHLLLNKDIVLLSEMALVKIRTAVVG